MTIISSSWQTRRKDLPNKNKKKTTHVGPGRTNPNAIITNPVPLKNEHLQTPPTLFSRCARVWQADEHTKRSFTWHAPASNHQPFSTVGLLFFFWDCRYACCHDNQKRAPMSALLNNYSFCGFVRQWWLGVLTRIWVPPGSKGNGESLLRWPLCGAAGLFLGFHVTVGSSNANAVGGVRGAHCPVRW